jgi:hypothetical protein
MAAPFPSTWEELAPSWSELDSLYSRGVFVELGAFTGFTLDDEFLGRLDFNPLDGDIAYRDVSESAYSVSVSRGRNRDLERTNAGSVNVQFRNENRRFDPRNPDSDIVEYVVPRRPVRVSVNAVPVFTGFVDDWNFDYSPGGQSTASLVGSDGFSLFARQVNSGGSAVEETSSERIDRVLDQIIVNWPADRRDIDLGGTTLGAGLLEGNVLTYLNDVESSESGLLFMTKDGRVGFRGRLVQPIENAVTFSDSTDGIRYQDIQISYGSDLLVNRSTVTSAAGSATAEDATSIAVYGAVENDLTTLLSSELQLQGLADYIVARYGQPEYRFENISVDLKTLSSSQLDEILGLELGDQANVLFTPNRIGSTISIRNKIIGISHAISVDTHIISFSFEALPFEFFILDDEVFGRLDDDAGVLGF